MRRAVASGAAACALGVAIAGAASAGTDYPAASWQPASTRNYAAATRPNSTPIESIVVHVTQGSFLAAVRWFQNPRADVSAHYVVRADDGAVAQTVPDRAIAWHAGNRQVNATSVGVEHEGFVSRCSGFTEPMYRSSARLAAFLAMRYGIPVDRRHVIGHSDVPDPRRPRSGGGADGHADPGRCWRWPHYLRLVKQFVAASPLNLPSLVIDDASDDGLLASGWRPTAGSKLRFGSSFLLAPAGSSAAATVSATLPTGSYAVYAWWPSARSRSRAVPLQIETATGPVDITVDQTRAGAQWNYLGTYPFENGELPRISVTPGPGGATVSDAFKFVPVRAAADSQFLDPTQAIALGAAGLLASRDGGVSWTNIAPPDIAAERLRATRFTDPSNGWLVVLGDGSALDLYQTADAGATWTRSPLPAPADLDARAPIAIERPDPLTAFIVVGRTDTGAFGERAALLATVDGGLSWKSRALPAPGRIRFSDPLNGWLAATAPANALFRTADGGKHWKPVTLPLPAGDDFAGMQPSLPIFDDALNGTVPATVIQGDRAQLALYATRDGGATWTLASTTATAVPVVGTNIAASALAASDWTAVLDQGRRRTTLAVTPGTPAAKQGASPLSAVGGKGFVALYQRVDATLEWAIVQRCSTLGGCSSSLVRSPDGGASWTVALALS